MSKLTILGEAVSLTTAAAQTAVAMNATPLAPGFNGVVVFSLTGATGSPSVTVEGSDDGGTTWTALLTVDAITAFLKLAEVKIYPLMRLKVGTVGTAGTASAYIIE